MEKTSRKFRGKNAHRELVLEVSSKRKIARWNRWLSESSETRPNLSGLNAEGQYFYGINFRGASLSYVDFRRVDMRKADLRGACLRSADLRNADLAFAKCGNADFREANLINANLSGVDCEKADFNKTKLKNAVFVRAKCKGATFRWANLEKADFMKANLAGANFSDAMISRADFTEAILRGAKLISADLSAANFRRANLEDAVLRRAILNYSILFETDLAGADLTNASVFHVLVRNIFLDERTKQSYLKCSFRSEQVSKNFMEAKFRGLSDLRVASFLSDLQDPTSISDLISAGSTSIVLILGRFTGRMQVLSAIENYLWKRGWSPVTFNFPSPTGNELSDTVRFIAAMSEFVIADLTEPHSVPLELQVIAPNTMVPVVPVIQSEKAVFSMFEDIQRRHFWVLQPVCYKDIEQLIKHFQPAIIDRVEQVRQEIQKRRRQSTIVPLPIENLKIRYKYKKKPPI